MIISYFFRRNNADFVTVINIFRNFFVIALQLKTYKNFHEENFIRRILEKKKKLQLSFSLSLNILYHWILRL